MRGALIAIAVALIFSGCPKKKARLPLPPEDATTTRTPDSPRNPGPARLPQDEIEPNNTPAQATVVHPGEVRGTIAAPHREGRRWKRDEDWFVLDVPTGKPRLLSLRVSGVEDQDLILQIMHPEKHRPHMTANHGKVGEEEWIPNYTTSGGKVYFRVMPTRGWRKQKKASGRYRITIDLKEQPADFEIEPNEPPTVATPIEVGKPLRGYLSDRRDRDWFIFRPKQTGKLQRFKLQLEPIPDVPMELHLVTKVRPRKSSRIMVPKSVFSLDSFALYPQEESILIKLQPRTAKIRINSAYKLTILPSTVGEDVEIEPNDYVERPTPLEADKPLKGKIDYPYDRDRFAIKLEKEAVVRVTISGVPGVDLRLHFGAKPDAGLINEGGVGEGETITNHYLAAGTHILTVLAKGNESNSEQSYTLTLKLFDASRIEREPNNESKDAHPLKLGNAIEGTIAKKGDVDFYKLDLSAEKTPKLVKISLSGAAKLALAMVLLDAKESAITRRDGIVAGESKSIVIRLRPAVYYLKITDPKENANPNESYRLEIR